MNARSVVRPPAVAALLGGTLALAAPTHAAVVALDLNALGLSGVNAGLASGAEKTVTLVGSHQIVVRNNSGSFSGTGLGTPNSPTGSDFRFLVDSGAPANPTNLGAGTSIGATPSAGTWWDATNQALFETTINSFTYTSPNFGAGSFMGFRMRNGSDWNYGYFEVTWDGTNFEILSGAYESTVNTAISTPSPSAVPGGAGLAAMAFTSAGLRRRRRA